MIGTRWLKVILGVVVAGWLAGCAHVISHDLREKTRSDLLFSTVRDNPDQYRGETVVWGGRIIETVNREGSTDITVLQMPLDPYGMPVREELSAGRFIARVTGYLDNQIYRAGRWVTVGGQVLGVEVLELGQTQYAYPVVAAREVHLWREPRYPYAYWGYPYGFGSPCGPWGFYPYPYYSPFWPYSPYPYGWW